MKVLQLCNPMQASALRKACWFYIVCALSTCNCWTLCLDTVDQKQPETYCGECDLASHWAKDTSHDRRKRTVGGTVGSGELHRLGPKGTLISLVLLLYCTAGTTKLCTVLYSTVRVYSTVPYSTVQYCTIRALCTVLYCTLSRVSNLYILYSTLRIYYATVQYELCTVATV